MGSIPFGLILAKAFKIEDLRSSGSGNIGATNALRVGGKKLGIFTLICDMLKGVVPIILAQIIGLELWEQYVIGLAAVIGHIAPVWLKFQGGKGVATAAAVLVTLDLTLGGVMCAAWLLTFYVTKISSLSSLIAITSAAFFATIVANDFIAICTVWILAILIIYRHKDNIIRLLNKQEKKFNSKL